VPGCDHIWLDSACMVTTSVTAARKPGDGRLWAVWLEARHRIHAQSGPSQLVDGASLLHRRSL